MKLYKALAFTTLTLLTLTGCNLNKDTAETVAVSDNVALSSKSLYTEVEYKRAEDRNIRLSNYIDFLSRDEETPSVDYSKLYFNQIQNMTYEALVESGNLEVPTDTFNILLYTIPDGFDTEKLTIESLSGLSIASSFTSIKTSEFLLPIDCYEVGLKVINWNDTDYICHTTYGITEEDMDSALLEWERTYQGGGN